MTVKRKTAALIMLVGVLSLAIYVGNQYTGGWDGLENTQSVESSKTLGQAAQVSGNTTDQEESASQDDYYTKAKLTRQQTRDEAKKTLQEVLDNSATTDELKKEALGKMEQMAAAIEAEGKIEAMLQAKGFDPCLVYISEEGANVMVDADGLDTAKAAQIKDVLLSETSLTAEQIKIVEVKK